jgi:hypothetical protein
LQEIKPSKLLEHTQNVSVFPLSLFVYSLFNKFVGSSGHTALSSGIILHNELDKKSNEGIMDYSELLSLHLSGETEENPQKSPDCVPFSRPRFGIGFSRM